MKEVKSSNDVFTVIGATNHSNLDRAENDFYATDPQALELLLKHEKFNKNIWEPAAGKNHLVNVLKKHNYNVFATDLIDRTGDIKQLDFLKSNIKFNGDILTNPPYNLATEFVLKALDSIYTGNCVIFLLKLTFLETKSRYKKLFSNKQLKTIYVSTNRLNCARNGDFEKYKENNAICYAWFLFQKGYTGEPIIKFFNYD